MKRLILLMLAVAAAQDQVQITELEINDGAASRSTSLGENEHPDLLEGDIIMTKSLERQIDNMGFAAKNGITGSQFDAIANRAWVNGRIPYVFSGSFNSKGRKVVREAIAEYHKHTCIRWVPRGRERSYVTFFHGSGCYSYIGQQSGPQRISLGYRCLHKGIAIHEMMHCAGFFHEQSRLDRDKYIYINWENIRSGVEYNFQKYRPGQASTLDEPYDKQSVMHYGNYAFTRQYGRKTITSRSDSNEVLGQRKGFSNIDIRQLNKYYKCKDKAKPTKKPTKKTTTTSCKDNHVFCGVLRSYCSDVWVLLNCKKACGKCPKPTQKPTPKPTPLSTCQDKRKHCAYWNGRGYCRGGRFEGFMRRNCRKSCGFCRK